MLLYRKSINLKRRYETKHTEVRWLGRGKVFNIVSELVEEICQFMDSKGKESKVLKDEKWKCELVFLVDITAHLRVLNIRFRGRDRMICDMYDAMKAFQVKLRLWETQMHQLNMSHFPCCQVMLSQVSATVFSKKHFADKLSAVRIEFTRCYSDFEAQKNNFELLRNPFVINVETALAQIQMELTELQCNGILKEKYNCVGPARFTCVIPKALPQLRLHATRTRSLFGSTYLCEQPFSVMKIVMCSSVLDG
ncbi:general transcription factor II-I repeat domain-containing protein 2-like [Octopus sinensis]|uniref:General transcription factor II-I repeat domain-containing protein 2-like n=1 Tax=Octopus sinensis TaxID=2607531 RepID=A0A6P7T834_9MOLL|nr:general transcription factor II-I repeat domain-containing protein 2-like [Octopus sinensis]